MPVAELELTENALAAALAELPPERRRSRRPSSTGVVLAVGSRALLNANRIVRSPGGPLYQAVYVREDRMMAPDAWELR